MSKTEEIAKEIIQMAHGTILLNMRFFETAMGNIVWKPWEQSDAGTAMSDMLTETNSVRPYACDGKTIYYDPIRVISDFKADENSIVKVYLHVILHLIFHHNFEYNDKRQAEWDLAVDVAVWAVMMDLVIYKDTLDEDAERRLKLKNLLKRSQSLTAQKLYRLFLLEPPSIPEEALLKRLFCLDTHELWLQPENYEITEQQWRKITERIKADLKSFSKNKANGQALELGLSEATKKKVDYSKFLRQFMMRSEAMHINDEEFDYIYYNYGLTTYGNMPLVEPLEYKDVNKINEFVIALDTSASCRGKVVQSFLQKTVDILRQEDTFFEKMNVHILQCDNQLQSDTKITSNEDFEAFLKNGKLTGFGSTDFRPVFEHVNELKKSGELKNIKGMIYFTDGYGIYPEMMPDYDVAFVFLTDDEHAPKVPAWAAKVVLDEAELQ